MECDQKIYFLQILNLILSCLKYNLILKLSLYTAIYHKVNKLYKMREYCVFLFRDELKNTLLNIKRFQI